MNKSERVAEMAREISDITEWRNTKLRKEKYFNWQSLGLFIVTVGILTLITLYFLTK